MISRISNISPLSRESYLVGEISKDFNIQNSVKLNSPILQDKINKLSYTIILNSKTEINLEEKNKDFDTFKIKIKNYENNFKELNEEEILVYKALKELN